MSSYKKVNINICENGYIVDIENGKQTFVFSTIEQLKKWLEDNITETGQVKDFCNGLDKGSNKTELTENYYWDSVTQAMADEIKNDIDNTIISKIIYSNV